MIKKVKQDKELRELFTKKEEYDTILLDKYVRFSYCLSSQRNVFEPEILSFLIKSSLSSDYPEEKKSAVCLTHNINLMCSEILNTAARTIKALKRRQFTQASIHPLSKVNKIWNPIWSFRQIIELEKNYGAKLV